MKSILVCNLLLLYCSISVFSQDNQMPQSSVDYGIKIGVNYSNNEYRRGSTFGFIGGGFINLKLSEVLSFQPEVLYSMKGSSGTDENGIDYKLNLNYIEFPLLLKIIFPSFSNIIPNIFGGPGLSFNVTNTIEQSPDKYQSMIWLGTTDAGTELILLFGGEGKIKINTLTLGLELRYTIGLRYMKRFEDFPYLSNQTSEGWEKATSVLSLIANLEI